MPIMVLYPIILGDSNLSEAGCEECHFAILYVSNEEHVSLQYYSITKEGQCINNNVPQCY